MSSSVASSRRVIERNEISEILTTEDLAEYFATPDIKTMETTEERDYEVNPTALYTAIQKKRWTEALTILQQNPDEAKTWVFRKESNSPKIRWRLLPIHGAIIFQAPAEVVEGILLIYPEGAAERDDEGSLPIHLAYKRAAPAAVCKLLLEAFPNSVDISDRKGRTPKQLASNSTGSKHREFVFALKNHLLTLRAARVSVRSEERVKFTAKLEAWKKEHEQEIGTLQKNRETEIAALELKIDQLEGELRQTQEASQLLVSHVTTIEAKIAQHEAVEKHLQVKVVELEADLDVSYKGRALEENRMKEEVLKLNRDLMNIQENVNNLLLEKEALNKTLDQVVAGAEFEKKALEESNASKDAEIERLKNENGKVVGENALLQADVEEKGATVASMTTNIYSLESELRELTESSTKALEKAQSRLTELEAERVELRTTVGVLTKKLRTVAGFLDEMTGEQDAIIEQADVHEAEMKTLQKEHTRILEEVEKQYQLDAKAQDARDAIMNMIFIDEELYARNTVSRKVLVDSIDSHSKHLAEGTERRQELVKSVKSLQAKIRSTRERIVGRLSDLVEKVGESSQTLDGTEDSESRYPQDVVITELGNEPRDLRDAGMQLGFEGYKTPRMRNTPSYGKQREIYQVTWGDKKGPIYVDAPNDEAGQFGSFA